MARSLVTETTLSTITPAEAEAKIAPVVALLEVPLLELRKSLGTNTSADPDPTVVAALTSASNATTATEDPHRLGLHALESTATAAPATPALRRTATEVSAAADRGQRLSTLLGQAHSTQASAAAKVDAIIADFRAKAKAAAPAVNGNNLDAIVALAEEAISEAVGVVGTASTDMDQYTRDTRGLTSDLGGTNGVTVPGGATEVAPGVYVLGRGGTDTYADLGATTTTTGDPAADAQIALQKALINGGVSLGTAAIDAGVQFGTHLIDKIAEVAMHGIDAGADLAATGIDTLAAGVTGAENGATIPAATTPGTTTPPATNGGGGPFAGLSGPTTGGGASTKPETAAPAAPAAPAPAAQAPRVEPPQPTPSPPLQAPTQQQPPAVQGGVIPPAARPQQDQETERPSAAPRHGQPGVVPANA
ncbi:hypothetical protein BOX37_02905 [Nocardia mangyaensis]|uniref:Uncharacterized protein n=1 Tax=Nocardia mangyaensis TaxID=2213200 RepID=A0A1J0VM42_9NOCA|nr:hypothetical protein [Nocardia mangyaensis]APE33088.1 hypothetical protein BOX37_02905 [Nocardia mangyaensis]